MHKLEMSIFLQQLLMVLLSVKKSVLTLLVKYNLFVGIKLIFNIRESSTISHCLYD